MKENQEKRKRKTRWAARGNGLKWSLGCLKKNRDGLEVSLLQIFDLNPKV
jgi:hypothetical protein